MALAKGQELRPLPYVPFDASFGATDPMPGSTNGIDLSAPAARYVELRNVPARPDKDYQRPQHSTSTSGHSSHGALLGPLSLTVSQSGAVQGDKSFMHPPQRSKTTGALLSSERSTKSNGIGLSQQANVFNEGAPSRKSMSKARKILGTEAPSLDAPFVPQEPRSQLSGSPPALPPKNRARKSHQAKGSVSRVPVPAITDLEAGTVRQSQDDSRKIDQSVFPLRCDDQFRANDNEFEMSDGTEPEEVAMNGPAGLPRLSISDPHRMRFLTVPKTERGPGVVRRSFDSIISPFRAGLLGGGGSSSASRADSTAKSTSNLTVPEHEPVADGRRSFSDFVRPFVPRHRNATLGHQTRPLSRVLDRPEDEYADVPIVFDVDSNNVQGTPAALSPDVAIGSWSGPDSHVSTSARVREIGLERLDGSTNKPVQDDDNSPAAADAASKSKQRKTGFFRKALPQGGAKPDVSRKANASDAAFQDTQTSASRPDPALPKMSSSRSLASSFGQSTSNVHDQANVDGAISSIAAKSATHQPSGRKFGQFFTKVKGSVTPKATPKMPSHELSANLASPAEQNSGEHGTVSTAETAVDHTHAPSKKAVRPLRTRAWSLTAPRGLSSSRSKDDAALVPAVPAIPVQFASSQRGEARRQEQLQGDRSTAEDAMILDNSSASRQTPLHVQANFETSDNEQNRSIWEESPRVEPSASFTSTEKASRPFGKLLRRKKAPENVDAVIESFALQPPKMSHPDTTDEAAPRSSMSSGRGFDVVDSTDVATTAGQPRTTIRKTLSPALLSDSAQPGIEATLADEELSSLGHGTVWRNESPERANAIGAAAEVNSGDDVAEEMREAKSDEQRFRSPLGRFIRGHQQGDRLSRVEELSERLSYISESPEARSARSPVSTVNSPKQPLSFGEHRFVLRNMNCNAGNRALPPALELAVPTDARPRAVSLDILRPGKKQVVALRDDSLETALEQLSMAASPSTPAQVPLTPRTPVTPGWSDQLTPSWRTASFQTARSARTSFSQDRDRAPVASPISPPLPSSRSSGVGQAFKRLGLKGKNSKANSKGIGPSDVIVLGFEDGSDADVISPETGLRRPSVSVEPRSSFGGGARPSFSNMGRPSIGGGRPSFQATGRNSLAAAEMVTKLLEVEASGLVPSPVTPTFGSNGFEQRHALETVTGTAALRQAHLDGNGDAGLGFGSMQFSESTPYHTADSMEASGSVSTSDGTFTSQGAQTPENESVSYNHSMMSQTPLEIDAAEATTPHAGGNRAPIKSADLLAFEDMLGRFPQQQKVLLQDISNRVAKAPTTSHKDCASSSGVFPSLAE